MVSLCFIAIAHHFQWFSQTLAHLRDLVLISPTFYAFAFVPKSFRQKITNPNCKHLNQRKKLPYDKAAHKILVKLTQVQYKSLMFYSTAPGIQAENIFFQTSQTFENCKK
jgi:hypothetical protein